MTNRQEGGNILQKLFIISLLLISAILFSPLLILPKFEENQVKTEETPPPIQSNLPQNTSDASYTFTAMDANGMVFEATMGDYLVGAVAAEMPALFESEALKAQAVSIRTYIMNLENDGNAKHPDADVCTDPSCCKGHISEETMRQNWGDDFDANFDKIKTAIAETDGEYLIYNGEIIQAVFHASSEGSTEASSAIWADVPYLVSVDSPETAEAVPTLVTKEEFTADELFNIILTAYPEAQFQDDFHSWLGEITYTDSGRVNELIIGNITLTGDEARNLFSLRSTDFDLEFDGENFVFTVRGYGHGIGMSQHGANILAKNGYSYEEILAHYYVGTNIAN